MFSLSSEGYWGVLQMGDSAFPIGGFSFSGGLEGAVAEGMVSNAAELADYTRSSVVVAGGCDAVAALEAFRSIAQSRLEHLATIDNHLLSLKLSSEMRTMTLRTGQRLTHLLTAIDHSALTQRWGTMVEQGVAQSTLPVAQAVCGALVGIDERGLYTAHLYSVASSILGASLRLLRVSHIATQQIMLALAPLVGELFELHRNDSFTDIEAFAPLIDVASSLHAQGKGRLFMS